MKPVIGITCSTEDHKHFINNDYVEAVIQAGGIPLIIPMGVELDIPRISDLVDGLMMSGGNDPNPLLYGQEPHPMLGEVTPDRDSLEVELARHFLYINKPIFGICRGMQVLNIAVGGTLYQDIHSENKGVLLQHKQDAPRDHQSHFISIPEGTLFHRLAGKDRIVVNSFHHQAVRDIAPSFVLSGIASDGIIEAIESPTHRFVVGVQWHPEATAIKGEEFSVQLFKRFVQECAAGR